MSVPEKLSSYTELDILTVLRQTHRVKKENLHVKHPASLFGRAVQKLTNQKSTLDERRFVHKIWKQHLQNNEAGTKSVNFAEKHLRAKKKRQLKKKARDAILDAECDLLVDKFRKINVKKNSKQNNGILPREKNPSLTTNVIHSTVQKNPTLKKGNPKINKRKERSPEKASRLLKRIKKGIQALSCVSANEPDLENELSLLSIHTNVQDRSMGPQQEHGHNITQQQDNEEDCENDSDNLTEINLNANIESETDPLLQQTIDSYARKIMNFPSFPCPICKRLGYEDRDAIKSYNFTTENIKQFQNMGCRLYHAGEQIIICKRCHDIFNRKKIPAMAFFNNMEVPPCPALEIINDVEARLISQIKPFMKIYHLSRGQGQFALKGSCLHFPLSVDEVVEKLPLNKNSADLLIVNQTTESSKHSAEFQVRPILLYQALQTLKAINPLYRNITIDEQVPAEDFQIHEIHNNEEENNENPQENGIHRAATGYTKINDNLHILRGTIHQGSAVFKKGNKSVCIAATAIAFTVLQPIISWSSTDMDNLLITGDQYFESVNLSRAEHTSLSLLSSPVSFYSSIRMHFSVSETVYSGYLNKIPGKEIQRLDGSLADFLESGFNHALLQVNHSFLGLIKENQYIFLFDCFSRGVRGKKAARGTACVLQISRPTAPDILSRHIQRVCSPSTAYSKDLSDAQKQQFQYIITPLTPTRLEEADQNLEQAPICDEHVEVLPVRQLPMATYIQIAENVEILRAHFHQGTSTIFPNGGAQCGGMSASAACHTLLKPVSVWTPDFLDNVLRSGDAFYSIIRQQQNNAMQNVVGQGPEQNPDFLEALDLNGVVDSYNGAQISCRVSLQVTWHGSLDMVPGDELIRLSSSIREFLMSDYNNAILTINIYCLALLKHNATLYIFDSHSRGERGNFHPNGTACVIHFTSDHAPEQASNLLHEVCAPSVPFNPNMPYQQLQLYSYTIRPIICSLLREAENLPSQNSQREFEQCPSARPNQQNAAANEGIPVLEINQPTHQQALMLDCVIRADEPNHPTVQHFVDACRSERNAIPEVNLRRREGNPMYPDVEKRLEELSFIRCLPYGVNGCNEVRKIPITPLDYFQQRIMGVNKNFHSTEYLFYALSRVEAHVLQQKIAICGNMAANDGRPDANNDFQLPGFHNIHLYMGALRGSGSYWKKFTGDVLGAIEQLGDPTFFLTISYDDLNSLDSITALYKAKHGPAANLPTSPQEMSFEERRQMLNEFPATAARHFSKRMNVTLQLLKNQSEYIFGGKLVDYTYRVEFQGRGSPHIHMLIWIENAPSWNTPEGIKFIEDNISCSLNVNYRDLVVRYQNHAHRGTCFKKHNACRFGFPRRTSDTTRILDEEEIIRSHGRFLELKRTPEEIMINNYHPKLLQILKCNMDIQAVTGTRAIAYYVGKYMSKGEPQTLRQEIKNIIKSFKGAGRAAFQKHAQQISMNLIKNREISAQEAAFRLLHLRLRHSSRSSVFLPLFPPNERIRLVHRNTIFGDEPKTLMNIVERYCKRPDSLIDLCLLEFAAWWKYIPKSTTKDLDKDQEVTDESDEELAVGKEGRKLALKDNKGKIRKRKRHAIVRYPRFKPLAQSNEYLYSMILLHLPLESETDLEEHYRAGTLREYFEEVRGRFRTHEDDPIINPEQIRIISDFLERMEEPGPRIDGDYRDFDENHGENPLEYEDVPLAPHEVFEQPQVNEEDHQIRVSSLTREQREIYDKVAAQIRLDLREPNQSQQSSKMRLIVHGSGGVGKSYLVAALTELINKELPGGSCALIKAAPTGIAARNINGVTLHKAFSLGIEKHKLGEYIRLGAQTLHSRRILFRNVFYAILDEFSMISYQILRSIHLRCTEIKGNDFPFGNINFIIMGDMLQLSPCLGHWIFEQPDELSYEQNLWELFEFVQLKTIMRQRGNDPLLHILQRLRVGTLRRDDVQLLATRLLKPMAANYRDMLASSRQSLHLYPTCKMVDAYNEARLNEMKARGVRLYTINAFDTFGSGNFYGRPFPSSKLPQDIRDCAGISHSILIGIGCRVMLKWNVDPLGGLCNGSLGTVRNIVWTGLRREQLTEGDLPEYVLVEFDGLISSNHYCHFEGYERCTIVAPKTFEFEGRDKQKSKVFRRQIPLVVSFSTTIHKAQGISLDSLTTYIGSEIFAKGQCYVSLSRARTFNGIYLTQIDEKQLLFNKQTGKGPASEKPLREVTKLELLAFLETNESEIDKNLLKSLINWRLEYVMCKNCKDWECICDCYNN